MADRDKDETEGLEGVQNHSNMGGQQDADKGQASGGNMGYGGAGELREDAGMPQDDSASDED